VVVGLLDDVRRKVLVGPVENVIDLVTQLRGVESEANDLILRSFQAVVRFGTHTGRTFGEGKTAGKKKAPRTKRNVWKIAPPRKFIYSNIRSRSKPTHTG
jgi:hypothetical protein